jgi:hypothetical protein
MQANYQSRENFEGEEMPSRKILAIFAITLALLGCAAWAIIKYDIRIVATATRPAGMVALGSAEDDAVWKLDADSVRGPKNRRQGWVIIDHSNDETTSQRTTKSLFLVDCNTTASREISQGTYDASGNALTGESYDPKDVIAKYYPPDSMGYVVVSSICADEFGA